MTTFVESFSAKLMELREKTGKTTAQIETELLLGPGWVEGIESGEVIPTVDLVADILRVLGLKWNDLAIPSSSTKHALKRDFYAIEDTKSDLLRIHFRYARHDATYSIPGGTFEQFAHVVGVLRMGLAQLRNANQEARAEAIKTESVARMFLEAVRIWPNVSPSDLWWFVVYRAYCDQFNHPVEHSRLDLQQSWKRTGGWALEEVLVRHYAPAMQKAGVRIFIANATQKALLLNGVKLDHRLELDKIDVLLTGEHKGKDRFFGVVHVKASFAERRTDDVPLSQALIAKGYFSPLWTMDCKGTPSATPVNKGELGVVMATSAVDARSAKRKDIEHDGYFSACYSYNKNTQPTPVGSAVKAGIFVCDFSNPNDEFSRAVIKQWKRFSATL